MATSNASHSIQNFNYASIASLEQLVWAVRSPSTLHSSKTITVHIQHMNLCHPSCKHKNIGERSFSSAGPSVWNNFPQTLHHLDFASSFKAALKTHLFNNYFWTVFHSLSYPTLWQTSVCVWVCACVCESICACASMCVCACMCVCVCVCVCVCLCMLLVLL